MQERKITWNDVKSTIRNGHINWRQLIDLDQQQRVAESKLRTETLHPSSEHWFDYRTMLALAELLDLIQDNITIEVDK